MPRALRPLLCLALLAGCDRIFGADDGGLISGTVTVEGASAPAAAARGTVPAGGPRLEALPGPGERLGGPPPPPALVVTFRRDAVEAPRAGTAEIRSPAAARRAAARMRARLEAPRVRAYRVTDLSPASASARIRLEPGADEAAVRRELLADPRVARVERDGYARAAAVRLPDAVFYPSQAWHYEMADLPRAWALTTGSREVLVAVVDDGIRFDHPDLAPNLTDDGYDFVSAAPATLCSGAAVDLAGDGDGYDPDPTIPAAYARSGECVVALRVGGHGTHVAGTIGAAGGDGAAVAGAAWRVRIRPVRVLNGAAVGSWFDVAQGILYAAGLPASDGAGGMVQAATGARVINVSLGGAADAPVLREAVLAATGAGALIVASAMNERTDQPYYPAAYPEVVSVAAVAPSGAPASYSNFGPTIDLAAPGGDLAAGFGASSFGVASTVWNFFGGQPSYSFWTGTSMAAPHVTGIAALVLAREPELTAAALRGRLEEFAVDAGAPGRDDRYGAGIVNARNALARAHAPPRALHVVLYDAATGARVRSVPAPDGHYTLRDLPAGRYLLYAGEDEDGDGVAGLPGRAWGAFGGVASPQEIEVRRGSRLGATFAVGRPAGSAANVSGDLADRLVVGGTLEGDLLSAGFSHYYAVRLPAGTYTLQASGRGGACRHALAADPELTLYAPSGAVVATHDDVDPARRDFCARITATLAAGDYVVRVRATDYPGLYAVSLREGG
jgi:subtilisin family serine protease